MKTLQTTISEVRLVYRTKVKASERLQVKCSMDSSMADEGIIYWYKNGMYCQDHQISRIMFNIRSYCESKSCNPKQNDYKCLNKPLRMLSQSAFSLLLF
jgi:hypothetical protein